MLHARPRAAASLQVQTYAAVPHAVASHDITQESPLTWEQLRDVAVLAIASTMDDTMSSAARCLA
ncbi:hypothetical protein FHR56_001289 [Xanthomonas sacchari]|nr:hypothetical protein [Xanthomonas sp. F10]